MCSEASLRSYPVPSGFGQQGQSSPILNESLAPTPINRPISRPEPPVVPVDPTNGGGGDGGDGGDFGDLWPTDDLTKMFDEKLYL